MKKHLNTLFVTTSGAYLFKEGETIAINIEKKTVLRLPIHSIGGIICFGNVTVSPYLLGFCAKRDVTISFLTEYGRFLASVHGPVAGNVLLRREQYRRADKDEIAEHISRSIIIAKITNCRNVLLRAVRDHSSKINVAEVHQITRRLTNIISNLQKNASVDVLRGFEGDAAHSYFKVFNHLIVSQKKHFVFNGRNRRPPLDYVNCLLSFLYTLLMHDVRSALNTVGLDPYVGFLHKDRPGRPGLALDMMEEFRPIIADRLALSLINLAQVKPNGFRKADNGAVLMKDDTKKALLTAYQKRKQTEIIHPFLKEKVTIGLLFHLQALLFTRFLRDDLDGYPPFIWK